MVMFNAQFLYMDPDIWRGIIGPLIPEYDIADDPEYFISVLKIIVDFTEFNYTHSRDAFNIERERDTLAYLLEAEGLVGVDPLNVFYGPCRAHYDYCLPVLSEVLDPGSRFELKPYIQHNHYPLEIYRGLIITPEPHGL